jgi:hypothetical protein
MKQTIYILLVALMLGLSYSCQDELGEKPVIHAIKMYMADVSGGDSLITEPIHGKAFSFVVETEANFCSVWPGGNRAILKKSDGLADSLDINNYPVLRVSDAFVDYGRTNAKGLKTSQVVSGWRCNYTYPNAGTFKVAVVVNNYGDSSIDVSQMVLKEQEVTVR